MKRTIWAGTIAALCFFLAACQAPSTTPSTPASAADTIAANPHGGGGQRVSLADIAQCQQAYQTTMAQYGITPDSPSVPMGKCPPVTYRITQSEALTYTTLRKWLDSVVNVMDSASHGSNLNLTIVPGICTQQFVTTYGLSAARVGRISFFLVPYRIDTTSAAKRNASPNDGGGDGFEIGGIQP